MKQKRVTYSVHPVVAYAQTIIRNLPKNTGKSLDEWADLVKESGIETQERQRAWLKKNYGLGGTTTGLIVDYIAGADATDEQAYLKEAEQFVELMYAGPKQELRPLYDMLIQHILSLGDDIRVCPRKTYIPIYRNHVIIQLKPTTNSRIDLGLALKGYKDALPSRLIETGGLIKGDRITHRITIEALSDIDEEVITWLGRAYALDSN